MVTITILTAATTVIMVVIPSLIVVITGAGVNVPVILIELKGQVSSIKYW
nr:hypothetical protein [Neobacillus sp. Marseille-Q6967]